MILKQVSPKPYLLLRSLATLVDYGIFFIVCFALIYTLGDKINDDEWQLNGVRGLTIPLFWLIYFVLLETYNQATLGHEIFRLIVVKPDGYKISFTDALKRHLCDPIDIGIYGIPALICISKTLKHQRLGDLLANTLVVRKTDIFDKEVIF